MKTDQSEARKLLEANRARALEAVRTWLGKPVTADDGTTVDFGDAIHMSACLASATMLLGPIARTRPEVADHSAVATILVSILAELLGKREELYAGVVLKIQHAYLATLAEIENPDALKVVN